MKLRSTLLAATVLALPMAARAQTPSLAGFYVGAGVGANYLQQEKISTFGGVDTGTQLRSSIGPVALGYLGYELGSGLSLQVEGDIRNNKFNSASGRPARRRRRQREEIRPDGQRRVRPLAVYSLCRALMSASAPAISGIASPI